MDTGIEVNEEGPAETNLTGIRDTISKSVAAVGLAAMSGITTGTAIGAVVTAATGSAIAGFFTCVGAGGATCASASIFCLFYNKAIEGEQLETKPLNEKITPNNLEMTQLKTYK